MLEYILVAHIVGEGFRLETKELDRFHYPQECNMALLHAFNDPQYHRVECLTVRDGRLVPRQDSGSEVLNTYDRLRIAPPTHIIIEER